MMRRAGGRRISAPRLFRSSRTVALPWLALSIAVGPEALAQTDDSGWMPPRAVEPPWDHLPTRPVRIVDHLTQCFRIPEDADRRRRCFGEAAETLRRGIRYQRCLWQDAPGGICSRPHAQVSCRDATCRENRANLLGSARQLASLLEEVARGGDEGELLRTVQEVRRAAQAVIMIERGTYSLVSQGGVSLGSWQAGYVYFVTEVLKRRRSADGSRGAFRTTTGASAGAVNALAAAVEGCRPTPRAPQESLVFDVWVNHLAAFDRKGAPGLLRVEGTKDRLSLFDPAPLERAIDAARESVLDVARQTRNCTFDFGFVVTHMKHRTTPVHAEQSLDGSTSNGLVQAPRLTERFPLRLTLHQGQVQVKSLEAKDPSSLDEEPSVPDRAFYGKLGTGGQSSLQNVLDGVRASGAFPIAFPPVDLSYQIYDVEKGHYVDRTSRFVDGGTLDNRPIGLAASMNSWSGSEAPNPWLADLATDPDTYVFVNPNVRSWSYGERKAPSDSCPEWSVLPSARAGMPWALERRRVEALRRDDADSSCRPEPTDRPRPPRAKAARSGWVGTPERQREASSSESMLEAFGSFGIELVNTSTDAQLMSTAEHLPFIRQADSKSLPRMVVPRRHLPITGEQLLHFMAFLERDFRVYDFVVGMADAREHFAQLLPKETNSVDESLSESRRRTGNECDEEKDPKCDDLAGKYVCLRSLYRTHLHDADLDLPYECHVLANTSSNFTALVEAMRRYRAWTETEYDAGEELRTFFSALEAANYDFKDVPDRYLNAIDGIGADTGELLVRNILEDAVEQIGDKHEGMQQALVELTGRAAADAAVRRFFPRFWSVGVADDGLEFEYGGALKTVFSPRLAARLDLRARPYLVGTRRQSEAEEVTTATTTFGAALRLAWGPFLRPGTLDFEVGVGAFFSPTWAWAKPPKTSVGYDWGLSMTASTVLLQRFYLLMDYERFFNRTLHNGYETTRFVERDEDDRLGLSAGVRFF